jgi:hypothetical protein
MPLYTRSQFAHLCGLKKETGRQYIGTNIKRGKVILSGDYIDDGILQNKEFLLKELEKNKAEFDDQELFIPAPSPKIQDPQIAKEVPIPKIPNVQPPAIPSGKVPNVKDPSVSPEPISYRTLEAQKKALDIEKIQEEIEILKVKKQKLHGELIPTDLVNVVFAQHFKSVTASFQNGIENLLTELAKKRDLNRNEVGEIRGKMIQILNISINDAIDESRKSVDNIIGEYSETKGVGERE